MTKSDEVREKIIKAFTESLNQHLFSETSYPKEVTVRTEYEDATQTITIKFN